MWITTYLWIAGFSTVILLTLLTRVRQNNMTARSIPTATTTVTDTSVARGGVIAYGNRREVTIPVIQKMENITMPQVTVTTTAAQYDALRKLSLKYEGMTVQQMAERLFRQVVRNYFKTELKQLAQKSGAQWDAATKLGFDTKLTREEYVNRSVKEARATWRELNGAANVFSFDADDSDEVDE